MNFGDEGVDLNLEILSIVKQAALGTLSDEDAAGVILTIVRDKHHCASCDMHACGDLEHPIPPDSVWVAADDVNRALHERTEGERGHPSVVWPPTG